MNTNTVLIGATLVLTLTNTTAIAAGAFYARKRLNTEIEQAKQMVEDEVQSTKDAVNKTVKGFAAALDEFEV